jgi:hypothetical protein
LKSALRLLLTRVCVQYEGASKALIHSKWEWYFLLPSLFSDDDVFPSCGTEKYIDIDNADF